MNKEIIFDYLNALLDLQKVRIENRLIIFHNKKDEVELDLITKTKDFLKEVIK